MEPTQSLQSNHSETVETNKQTYEVPQIIYEGIMTTRAGSPFGRGEGESGVDPADLFGK
jgi:hypothetical protein